jgi:hypothetical protein
MRNFTKVSVFTLGFILILGIASCAKSTTEPPGNIQGGAKSGGATGKGGTTVLSGGATVIGSGGVQAGGTVQGGSGGSNKSGGASSSGGGGGTSQTGGVSANGGITGGSTSTGGATGVSYKLPPPDRCHDQDYIPYEYASNSGCKNGEAATDCGGKCQVINACAESKSIKPYADVTFVCPRNMLFSPEMEQAAADDGNTGFHYAIVGHDVDRGGIDGNSDSSCCQCYQLVYAYPSPSNDRQGQLNPDNPNPPASAIPVPPPLIVQSFNTAATPTTFDVYMAAGGLGAHNACAQVAGSVSASGQYMYTSYPAIGQPSQGGLKPASLFPECRTKDKNWLTTASLSEPACQQKIAEGCNQIESTIPGLTNQSRKSCLQSNSLESFYHLNWSVYVMKVECPESLTRVTGCKLAPQGLPVVKRDVTTAAQASKDPAFWAKTGSENKMYETTTMEDCCRPSCAAINWIEKKGLKTDPQYRAFYSCDAKGVPYTQ